MRFQSLAVIIPVSERASHAAEVYTDFSPVIASTGLTYEFIYIVDSNNTNQLPILQSLSDIHPEVRTIEMAKNFGDATALALGISETTYDLILTLPAYPQIEPGGVLQLISALGDYDMAVARRNRDRDSFLHRAQAAVFHQVLKAMIDTPFQDLGCGVRAFRREIMSELNLYGDQHRFLPLFAAQLGFRVTEIVLPQDQRDRSWRVYAPGIYIRRLLDMLGVVFLLKFTQKPLRFFGLIGVVLVGIGGALGLFLAISRIFMEIPLADRPLLVLAAVLFVLGVQMIAIGLVGEIIIFTRRAQLKPYAIDRIIG